MPLVGDVVHASKKCVLHVWFKASSVFLEITCNFRSDGVLAFEAPYYEPAKIETHPDTKIEIEHK